jgi:hypothetical protein
MQNDDPEAVAGRERVQALCRDLTDLVTLSGEQRRSMDRLLGELETLAEQAGSRPRVKAAGKGQGSSVIVPCYMSRMARASTPDPCHIIDPCPVCKGGPMCTMYDKPSNITICICVTCGTSVSVPEDAWRNHRPRHV